MGRRRGNNEEEQERRAGTEQPKRDHDGVAGDATHLVLEERERERERERETHLVLEELWPALRDVVLLVPGLLDLLAHAARGQPLEGDGVMNMVATVGGGRCGAMMYKGKCNKAKRS